MLSLLNLIHFEVCACMSLCVCVHAYFSIYCRCEDEGQCVCMGALIHHMLLCVINQRHTKSKSQGWSLHQGHIGSITMFSLRIRAIKDVWKEVGAVYGAASKTLLMLQGPVGIYIPAQG